MIRRFASPRAHCALVFALTLAAYWPVLDAGFIWDDAGHVTNPELQSWSGLARIWFEPGATQQYYPLLHSAFWLEHRLWGDAAPGYHLINLLWHATVACLLVALLRRLAVPGALLAGLIFALHPVAVESVAWIAEQKNTLSTVFYLAAALACLRYDAGKVERLDPKPLGLKRHRLPTDDLRPEAAATASGSRSRRSTHRAYALATILFLAALLTKTVTATLPAALLVVAWWQRGRVSWRGDVRPLLPWLVAGVGAGLFTAWFERTGIGAHGADFNLSLIERGLLAGRAVWFYFGKLVWPADLIFFYPRWQIDAAATWQYLFPAAALALLVGLIWWARSRRDRGPLAAALLFGGTLVPVLGFVNVYPFVFSYVADHFQYLASLGMITLLTAAAVRGFARLAWPRWSGPAAAGALLLALSALTWRQSAMYRDVFALYESRLARNPSSWVAHLNLGTALDEAGRTAESLPHLRRALELKPDHPETLNSLGNVLNRLGRADEARPLLERAIQIQPRFAAAHNTLGVSLIALNRAAEGVRHFQRALELQPRLVEAHYNLGLAAADRGDFAAAIPHFAAALRHRPGHAGAELNWGVALALSDRLPEARPHFERALRLDPESAPMRHAYARVLLNAGDFPAALDQLRDAQRLDPALRGLHRDLAFALERLGRTDEARLHALEASRER